jgi:anti-anti-sigma factor
MPSATLLMPKRHESPLPVEPRPGPDTVAVRVPRQPLEDGSKLSVVCRRRRESVLFRLSGNLDIYTVPRFVRQIEFFDPAADQLLVDLANVRLLDSAGICALVSLRNRTHRAGRRFGLVGSSPRMRRLLGYAGLGSSFGEDRTTVPALPGA